MNMYIFMIGTASLKIKQHIVTILIQTNHKKH